jgi:serine/threonine protein phosphatase PrpC
MSSVKAAATSLVALAKERGGYDNITVVIVEINEKTQQP